MLEEDWYHQDGGIVLVYKNEDGKFQQPDVIVHIPEKKDIIIDSKMSLTAYERYCSSENDIDREKALKEHIISIQNHIKELSLKNYYELTGIKTLNYILMFIPVESAFMLAIEKNRNLFKDAFEKNIIIVSPTTLLATLRTIQNIWQYEYQNTNVQKIADKAGKLYDQFVAFIIDLDKIEKFLNQTQLAYEDAKKHLCTGRGNLVKRADELKNLGIKNRKKISNQLVEKSKIK